MSKIEAFYTLEVKDKNGKTVSKVTKPCHSFVIGFLQLVECQLYQGISVTVNDVTGTPTAQNNHAINLNLKVGATEDGRGMLVGTGTTPVDNLDYTMETQIAHGTGAGQLSYGSMSKITSAEIGANVDFQMIRTFSNTSGSTINVTEIGLYCYGGGGEVCMILHEIVTLTPVANGQTLTVTITFRTTV